MNDSDFYCSSTSQMALKLRILSDDLVVPTLRYFQKTGNENKSPNINVTHARYTFTKHE